MISKTIALINIAWQSVFLVGAAEFPARIISSGKGSFLSLGHLWPFLIWGIGVLTNIYYLIFLLRNKSKSKERKYIILGIALAVVPAIVAWAVGFYFRLRTIDAIMGNI